MMESTPIIVIIVLSLTLVFCSRHFVIQLGALKLCVDTLVVAVTCYRFPHQTSEPHQALGWIVAALGLISFFMLTAAGLLKFSKSEDLNLEGHDN